MNTFTRQKVGGRKPALPSLHRHRTRNINIPGIGACAVAWHVAAGLFVGELCESRGVRYIVPVKPAQFPDARIVCYSGPRPYWFYFYVVDQVKI